MSDQTPEMLPNTTETTTRPSTATIVVALLIVLAAGIGIGYAVNRSGPDGSSATATDTPSSEMPTGPSQPGQTAPGTRPTAPVAEGSSLTTISTPPEATLAMIESSKLKADASYTVTFSPFGYGPPQGGRTVVIRIATAEADNESARAMDLNGRNMLAQLGPGTEVVAGGTYTGTLTFRSQGDLLVPVIGDVSAK